MFLMDKINMRRFPNAETKCTVYCNLAKASTCRDSPPKYIVLNEKLHLVHHFLSWSDICPSQQNNYLQVCLNNISRTLTFRAKALNRRALR